MFCLCGCLWFIPVQLHFLLHSHSDHVVEHMLMNDQTPQDFLRFFGGWLGLLEGQARFCTEV